MKTSVTTVCGLSLVLCATSAFSQTVLPSQPPSAGLAACQYEIPDGAHIDGRTQNISMNGIVIGKLPKSCGTVSDSAAAPAFAPAAPATSNGGYYNDAVWSNYFSDPSANIVDDFGVYFAVPQYPGGSYGSSENQDFGPEYFTLWNGVVAYNVPHMGDIVLQPVLEWESTNGSPHEYVWGAFFAYGTTFPYTVMHSALSVVSPGDTLNGEVWQNNANPDNWTIRAVDVTTGSTATLYFDNATAPFNAALITLEGFAGGSNPGGPFPDCKYLPPPPVEMIISTLDTGVAPTYTPYPEGAVGTPFSAEAGPPGSTQWTPTSPECGWTTTLDNLFFTESVVMSFTP
jgi:hypothetical protein